MVLSKYLLTKVNIKQVPEATVSTLDEIFQQMDRKIK